MLRRMLRMDYQPQAPVLTNDNQLDLPAPVIYAYGNVSVRILIECWCTRNTVVPRCNGVLL